MCWRALQLANNCGKYSSHDRWDLKILLGLQGRLERMRIRNLGISETNRSSCMANEKVHIIAEKISSNTPVPQWFLTQQVQGLRPLEGEELQGRAGAH